MKQLNILYQNLNEKEFKQMLRYLDFDNPFYFTLYEHAPENLKPQLKNDDHFTKDFCSRVERLPESEFNKWFFDKNIKDFYDLEGLKLLIEKSGNPRLKTLLERVDQPKSIEEILTSIFYNRVLNPSKYQALIEQHLYELRKINNKKLAEKSPIAFILYGNLKTLSNGEKLKVCEEMHLDIIKITTHSINKSLSLDIDDLSLNQLELILEEMKKNDEKYYTYHFNKFFKNKKTDVGLWNKVVDTLQSNHPERLEKSCLLADRVLDGLSHMLRMEKAQITSNLMELTQNPHSESLKFFINSLVMHSSALSGSGVEFKKLLKLYREEFTAFVNPLYIHLQKTVDKKTDTKSRVKI